MIGWESKESGREGREDSREEKKGNFFFFGANTVKKKGIKQEKLNMWIFPAVNPKRIKNDMIWERFQTLSSKQPT